MPTTRALAKAAGNFRCYLSALFQPSQGGGIFLPDRETAQWLVNRSQGEREWKKGKPSKKDRLRRRSSKFGPLKI